MANNNDNQHMMGATGSPRQSQAGYARQQAQPQAASGAGVGSARMSAQTGHPKAAATAGKVGGVAHGTAAGAAAGVGAGGGTGAGAGVGRPGAGTGAGAGVGRPGAPTPDGQKGPGKRTTIVVVIGVIVAALAIWLLVWLFACNGNSLLDSSARDGQAPYKSEAEMQAELNRQVEEGMFNISIASVIQFDDGASEGTAFIENVPGNHYNMQVTITEDATGDALYESGILKPNQFIESIALAKDLEPGTYEATATFTALDENSYDEVGKAAAKVTINVLG